MRDEVSHLCHTALQKLARPAGFEPATPGLEGPSSETSKKWPTLGDLESPIGYL